jgi:hypothetical protein
MIFDGPARCCGHELTLRDIKGLPAEIRYVPRMVPGGNSYPPFVGFKWTCPTCDSILFIHYSTETCDFPGMKYTVASLAMTNYHWFNDEPPGSVDCEPQFTCSDEELEKLLPIYSQHQDEYVELQKQEAKKGWFSRLFGRAS